MNEINNSQDNKETSPQNEWKLRKYLDAFGNMFALNICFIIGSLPVLTIGASLSALYAMCIRLQENEEETIVEGFIYEYKRSFRQSTISFLIIVAILFIMFFEYLLVNTVTGTIAVFYIIVLILECLVLALMLPFLFPLISRYNNSTRLTFRNAFLLSIGYPGSWIKILVAWTAPILLSVIYPEIFVHTWYLWLLMIFGAIAYGTSFTARKVFRQNESNIERSADSTSDE